MFHHYLALAKRNPFKFLISFTIVAMLITLAIVSLYTVLFSIYFPLNLKDKIYNETGFYVEGDKIYSLIWNGKIEIRNTNVMSPIEFENRAFLDINRLTIYSDYASLLKGEIKIYGFSAKLNSMTCCRKEGYVYNLKEFLNNIQKFVKICDNKDFKGIKVEIDECQYIDASDSSLTLKRDATQTVEFQIDDISNSQNIENKIRKNLEKSDATFILQGIF